MNTWKNPLAISFSDSINKFKQGTQTPRDLLERYIDNFLTHEKSLKAFVSFDLEAARKAADESTKRYKNGQQISIVDGLPIGVKDIMNTKDLPTQMGSPAFSGWESNFDCAAVYSLRQAGAIIFGKTVTTEFAVGYSGFTTNPFDSTRTPGGSSSGSAAAVGAGFISVGLGTQTQGSTLRPASYCGVVGFKPTLGALNMAGIHPLSATNDHLGLIGASLEDTWRVASQISLGIGSPGYGFLDGAGHELPIKIKPKKLIRLYTRGWSEIDSNTINEFEKLISALADKGVEIISKSEDQRVSDFEDTVENDIDTALDIVAYEMQWPFKAYIEKFGTVIGERIHSLMKRADQITPNQYLELLKKRQNIRKKCRDLLIDTGADSYITLSASGPAPIGLKYSGSRSFIVLGSWLGFPAFSLPILSINQLPLGIQLLGLDGKDGQLCSLANWFVQEFE